MRLSGELKHAVLPFYNGGFHAARRAGEYLGAIAHGRFERCECCGRFGPMLYRPRAIPPKLREVWGLSPRLAKAVARKETLDCAFCGAKLRARRLARVIMQTYSCASAPQSLHEWARCSESRALRVAEINRIEGVHEAIVSLPGLAASDYSDPDGPRAKGEPPSENLSRLSYEDDSFDLVLTSETLEHIPDLDTALKEIRRILKPGGSHLFTIPLLPGVPKTYARKRLDQDGRAIALAPPISHPGGDWGYPVFTEFGADLPEILERAGFSVDEKFGPVTEDDVAQVFVCRKV